MDEVAVEASLRVINAHHQLCCGQKINLQRLNDLVGENGRFHRGRPTMLTCRIMSKRVQFFPNGTIQLLGGGVTRTLLHLLHQKVSHLLLMCDLTLRVPLSPWKLNNIVISFNFGERFKFNHLPCNQSFSYEPELFPAALISKWHPVHITLFPNGKGMLTGVKDKAEALIYLRKVYEYIT